MEELEIKHHLSIVQIAPYLPYNLEFVTDKGKWVLESTDKAGWLCVGRKAMYCEEMSVLAIKLLLLPLSELKKNETPLSDYDKTQIGSFLYDNNKFDISLLEKISYWGAVYLIKHHFDVFGLIENGLAVDKTKALGKEATNV